MISKHGVEGAPLVSFLPMPAPARVLACGAWLKNTACLIEGQTVYTSAMHGDLEAPQSREALQRSVEMLLQCSGGRLDAVAHDLHPDFYSTMLAQQLSQRLGVPAIGVQHHHAHLAQVAAQQVPQADCIGWALDGVGWGDDQTAWGGEMLAINGDRFERVAHLPVLPLPGGDAAAREPWRMGLAVLHQLRRIEEADFVFESSRSSGLLAGRKAPLPMASLHSVIALIDKRLNCPLTTSAGRWFDAVAAILGICWHQQGEAQAAVALERVASEWLGTHHEPLMDDALLKAGLNFEVLMLKILDLMHRTEGEPRSLAAAQGEGAALFHLALARSLAGALVAAARKRQLEVAVLGGGCFFNNLLRGYLVKYIVEEGLSVHVANDMNVGDAGVALGQAWVAAHAVSNNKKIPAGNQARSKLCA